MHSVPETCKHIKMYLSLASTCLKQADFDCPLGACLIQVGLYKKLKYFQNTTHGQAMIVYNIIFFILNNQFQLSDRPILQTFEFLDVQSAPKLLFSMRMTANTSLGTP